MKPCCTFLLFFFGLSGISPAQNNPRPTVPTLSPEQRFKMGHSIHGEAFDRGPREKPWEMEGIGKTHFTVTTKIPEVQKWFDQGHTLLHSFWFYEAERAFRWCLKLDPECAMAYWGLARAVEDQEHSRTLIQEAVKRKDRVSEREQLYIEAWAERWKENVPNPTTSDAAEDSREKQFKVRLEGMCLKYPDDLEARSLLGLENLGSGNRLGTELLLQQVLARNPVHPGAHHYRIHNWDGPQGEVAVESCAQYGRIAPQIGHAQHMPGHVYSGIGMWHEAAISMDSATRVEAAYMRRRLTFPFNTWNYAHNRNYLSYIQEQLGMAEAALAGARSLLDAPLDPKYDDPEKYGTHWQGMIALMRGLIKFERWKEILDAKTLPWRELTRDKMYRAYCETLAHLGLEETGKALKRYADHAALKKELEKSENKWLGETFAVQSLELRGLLALQRGETLSALGHLADAASRELKMREQGNDPPSYPNVLYNVLGRTYLQYRSPALAAEAFEKTLTITRNDAFALAGLVEARSALGEKERAREAMSRLLHVWSGADTGLKWLERARKVGIQAEPRDSSPAPQRKYRETRLDNLGPALWEPYEAPRLAALDPAGKQVTLDEYRGKNVLLIFFLGSECPHCMQQLSEVSKRQKDFREDDVEVLAVSWNPPAQNASTLKVKDLPFRLLSDTNFENARRFKSYDDFEETELHSTLLIDRKGRVHWARHGGAPFKDFDFLFKEIKRLNGMVAKPGGL
jgi:peroxiredoxin